MLDNQIYMIGGIALALVLMLGLIWFVPYWRKRRRNRPINLPPKPSTDSIRSALAIDIDASPLTMPEGRVEGKAHYLLIDTESYSPIQSSDEAEQYCFSEPIALSWQILDAEGNRLSEFTTHIRRDEHDTPIPSAATEIHGITQDMMMQGISPEEAYTYLEQALRQCEVLVAHNLDYHLRTIREDMQRLDLDACAEELGAKQGICTMLWGKSLGFKTWYGGEALYPRLDELFGYLYFGRMHLPLSYKSKTLRDVRLLSACLRHKLNAPFGG